MYAANHYAFDSCSRNGYVRYRLIWPVQRARWARLTLKSAYAPRPSPSLGQAYPSSAALPEQPVGMFCSDC
jgi:hypothetical protein